jgi:RNA polymerase sigma factor (sigma-70 family)
MNLARQREPVAKRPDDPNAKREKCRACGKRFGVVALHADGTRTGRDRCPHCTAQRPIPDALHPTYEKWFGLVQQYARRAVERGADPEAAYDGAHDVYRYALLRWVPDRGTFSTIAIHSLNYWLNANRAERPACTLSQLTCDGGEQNRIEDVITTSRRTHQPAEEPPELPRLRAALATLDERVRLILEARHGIGRAKKATLRELAAELGISRERVRVLEARALAQISTTMQGGNDVGEV